MNRRQAIFRITAGGAAITAAVGGYKWYDITKKPNLSFLDKSGPLLSSLVDTIIPATDTPGALAANAHEFVILMIKECTDRKSQNRFVDGLADLQAYSLATASKPFEKCPVEVREEILNRFEKKGRPYKGILGKIQNKYLGRSFFTTLKQYTVEGYCTSKIGAMQGLAYLPVPGSYRGCIPLTKGQRAWATN